MIHFTQVEIIKSSMEGSKHDPKRRIINRISQFIDRCERAPVFKGDRSGQIRLEIWPDGAIYSKIQLIGQLPGVKRLSNDKISASQFAPGTRPNQKQQFSSSELPADFIVESQVEFTL